ncbi:MAG: hypothetical protein ACR2KK_08895 [Acidimicrobiales bacterium]
MAELHGGFDGPDGSRPDPATYALASREAKSLQDHPGAVAHHGAAGDALLVNVDQLKVEYLPDPVALGVLVTGLPGPSPSTLGGLPAGTTEQGVNRVSFYDGRPWPDARPFRLKLEGGPPGSLTAPVYDPGSRVLTVKLPPAEMVRVELSCYTVAKPTDPPDEKAAAALGQFGVWQWIAEAPPGNLDVLQREAQLGRFWLLTPSRPLDLVHAVRTPVEPPVIQPDGFQAERPGLGQTEVSVKGTVTVHAKSTSKIDLAAEWADLLDDPANPGNNPLKRGDTRRSPVGESGVNARPTVDVEHRLQVGDTKHHVVTFRATGTSSFREYFPPTLGAADFTVVGPEVSVSVESSARPLAPIVEYSVPTFAWQRQDLSAKPEDGVIYRSVRTGRGLRVYLGRPWYSSGDGELLGVVFVTEPVTPDTPLSRVVTRWGADPVWKSGANDPAVTEAMFPGARVEHDLSVPELADGSRVSVAGYAPQFDDKDRKLWFCDIELGDPAAPQSALFGYFPFVRLALARYQPESLSADVKLSPVVTTDPVQVGPDRTLTVSALPRQPQGMLRRRVEVSGTTAANNVGGNGRQQVEVSVLRRMWAGNDLGWTKDDQAVTKKVEASNSAWEIAFPADGEERRLNVREHEDFIASAVKP